MSNGYTISLSDCPINNENVFISKSVDLKIDENTQKLRLGDDFAIVIEVGDPDSYEICKHHLVHAFHHEIQMIRKKIGLKMTDKVNVYYGCDEVAKQYISDCYQNNHGSNNNIQFIESDKSISSEKEDNVIYDSQHDVVGHMLRFVLTH